MRGDAAKLALLLAMLAGISSLQVLRTGLGSAVLLSAGGLLLAGIFAGNLFYRLGFPKLTGYLLIGIVVGPYALGFIPREGVAGLQLVKGLAVALIAMAAGAEMSLALVRNVGRQVLALCAAATGIVFAASLGVTLAAWRWVPFMQGLSFFQALAVAGLLASMAASFSPTVTLGIAQETGARGPFTEFLMALVIMGDLIVMVAFALMAGLARSAFGGRFDLGLLAGGIGWELFGSVLAGAVIGFLALLYFRWVKREIAIFISGLCFALAESGAYLHLSPLLLSLAAGVVIANLDPPQGERLHSAVRQAGLPVFALFFAAAGAGLDLSALGKVGPLAAGLVLVRGVGIYAACRRFGPAGAEVVRRYVWMGLVSQAGVTFGFAALVAREFPAFGSALEALVVAMVTINQLVGPPLTRRALAQAGEIRAPEAAKV